MANFLQNYYQSLMTSLQFEEFKKGIQFNRAQFDNFGRWIFVLHIVTKDVCLQEYYPIKFTIVALHTKVYILMSRNNIFKYTFI